MFKSELTFDSLFKATAKSRGRSTRGRENNGLSFKLTGESILEFDEKTLTAKKDDVIFFPKNSHYKITLLPPEDSQFILLNFEGNFGTEPRIISGYNKRLVLDLLERLYSLQARMEEPAVWYEIQSIMYEIVAELIGTESRSTENPTLRKIKKSFDYLHENIFNPELEIDKLYEKSNVSNACFRSAFKEITGMTPKRYVTEKRMEYARKAILTCEFEKMSDLALSCGYYDPLYFGKVFKSYYSVSPKKYADIMRVSR